jgi:hypothetical protein
MLKKCIGLYCGRTKLNDNNYSDCGVSHQLIYNWF